MNDVMLNIAMLLVALIGFLLGLRFGYSWHRSEIIPKKEIENPRFQVIYIDPKIVRKMYGIPEPKSGR
jgi:hypothetical protein